MSQPDSFWRSLGLALAATTQFFAGLAAGGIMGFGLDYVWPALSPFGLLAGLVTGLALGTLILIRRTRKPDA